MTGNRFRIRVVPALLVLQSALLLTTAVAFAQTSPARGAESKEPSDAVVAPTPDTLVIANRPVFTFRAVHSGISPHARAMAASVRVETAIDEGTATVVDSREIPNGLLITVGGEGVFRVLQADLDPEGEDTFQALCVRTMANLRVVLAEQNELKNIPRLLRSLGLTALATVAFLLSIGVLGFGARWLRVRLERLALRGVDRIRLGGFSLQYADKVASVAGRAVAMIKLTAWLAAGYIWLAVVLSLFPYTRPWGEGLDAYLVSTAAAIAMAIAGAIPGLVIVAVIVIIARSVARGADLFFRAVQQRTVSVTWVHPDTAEATRRIFSVALWLFAVVLAYPYLPGSSSDAFKGVSVFAGLMISLGSTTVVGQILSGFIIIYSRTFRPGDYVRVGETEGVVDSIGLFATRIDNMKRERVSIPNSVIVGTEVKNYTLAAGEVGVILYTSITIGYGSPWRQVHAMLLQAADLTPGLRKTPAAFVNQTALSDFYVEYQINAYLEEPEKRMRTLAALHSNIQDVFNEHGVQIMSPHYEMDPAAPVVVPRENWFTPPARPE